MRRLLSVLILMCLLLALLPGALAQDEPPPTEEPPTATEEPDVVTVLGEGLPVLVNARNDLELLATSEMGNERPPGWSGSLDVNDPQLAILIRLDLELLTGTLLGVGGYPADWFGANPGTNYAIARDIRHDLELLADALLTEDFRLPNWSGDIPLMRCNRSTQALVRLLELGGVFTLPVAPDVADYCHQTELAAAVFTEVNLLSNPIFSDGNVFATNPSAPPAAWTINNDFAVGFLDQGAALSVGTIPNGEGITPLARSYAQFSKMTLVSGENFLVFVEYTYTTITELEFEELPNAAEMEAETYCGARWCGAG